MQVPFQEGAEPPGIFFHAPPGRHLRSNLHHNLDDARNLPLLVLEGLVNGVVEAGHPLPVPLKRGGNLVGFKRGTGGKHVGQDGLKERCAVQRFGGSAQNSTHDRVDQLHPVFFSGVDADAHRGLHERGVQAVAFEPGLGLGGLFPLPAFVQFALGFLAGQYLRRSIGSHYRNARNVLAFVADGQVDEIKVDSIPAAVP
jgi:hypothetical protein